LDLEIMKLPLPIAAARLSVATMSALMLSS
jgi:hypothetical protein